LEYVFTNASTGDRDLLWVFADGERQNEEEVRHTFTEDGRYTTGLIATNEYGCSDTFTGLDSIVIQREIYVPNSFSPNNDGNNDDFGIKLIGEFERFELIIFNRWGEQLFVSRNPDERWDGFYMGELVPNGVYFYTFFAVQDGGRIQTKKGEIRVLY
jgi:gliding motility-associated-like protein